MTHWIWTILIGFAAGMLAKALTSGGGPGGFVLTAVLGVGGSLAATFIGQAIGLYPQGHGAGFIASILGAAVLLLVYHFATKK